MTEAGFDWTGYRLPSASAASLLATARALLVRLPKDAPPIVRQAAKRLRDAAGELQAQWALAQPAERSDPRLADTRLDRAWSALHGRLMALATLESDAPEVSRTSSILLRLFPSGLAFLRLPYAEEWAESDRRLRAIEEEKLTSDIDTLAGPLFLKVLRAAHEAYGEALGITKEQLKAEAPKLGNAMKALMTAIGSYARVVVGQVDDADPGSVEAAQQQLSPITEARARSLEAAARKGKGAVEEPTEDDTTGAEDEEPADAPLPPVDA